MLDINSKNNNDNDKTTSAFSLSPLFASKIAFHEKNISLTQKKEDIICDNVEFNINNKEFIFFNNGKTIGSFTVAQLVSFVLQTGQDANKINETSYDIMKKYVVSIEITEDRYTNIMLKKETSPLMNNYKMLLFLSKYLIEFDNFDKTLQLSQKQKYILKRLIINVLEYTIRIIAIIIESKNTQKDAKTKLFHHSIILHGYCNEYISSKLNEHLAQFELLNNFLNDINKLQKTIDSKQLKLEENLRTQNMLLVNAINKLENLKKENDSNIIKDIRTLTDKIKHVTDDENTKLIQNNNKFEVNLKENNDIFDGDNKHDLEQDNNFDDKYKDTSSQKDVQLIESSIMSALHI